VCILSLSYIGYATDLQERGQNKILGIPASFSWLRSHIRQYALMNDVI